MYPKRRANACERWLGPELPHLHGSRGFAAGDGELGRLLGSAVRDQVGPRLRYRKSNTETLKNQRSGLFKYIINTAGISSGVNFNQFHTYLCMKCTSNTYQVPMGTYNIVNNTVISIHGLIFWKRNDSVFFGWVPSSRLESFLRTTVNRGQRQASNHLRRTWLEP